MGVVVEGHKLYPWQRAVIDCYDKHPKNSIIVVKSARQRGKTDMLLNLLMRETINHERFRAIIICPTYKISMKQYKEVEDNLKKIPNLIISANRSYLEIELYNRSIIKFKSAKSKDNLRGETAELLIFDEGAFISLETALECFNYTNTTNGNIIITSTPTFKDEENLFYKYYHAAELNEPNVYLIDFCEYDTSALMPVEKMEMYKKTYPHNIYCNEILGEFLTESSTIFGDFSKVLRNDVTPDNNNVMGIDFSSGTNNDETAITCFNSKKGMFYLNHFNDKDTLQTIEVIINVIKEYNIKKCTVELNSMGKTYRDLLAREISVQGIRCQIIDFNTTNSSKREIIDTLNLNIQNRTCTLLNEQTLKLQMASFEVKTTKTGLLTYGNSSDRIHDDIVMSIALALNCFKSGNYAFR